jgi:hypothetical protein
MLLLTMRGKDIAHSRLGNFWTMALLWLGIWGPVAHDDGGLTSIEQCRSILQGMKSMVTSSPQLYNGNGMAQTQCNSQAPQILAQESPSKLPVIAYQSLGC